MIPVYILQSILCTIYLLFKRNIKLNLFLDLKDHLLKLSLNYLTTNYHDLPHDEIYVVEQIRRFVKQYKSESESNQFELLYNKLKGAVSLFMVVFIKVKEIMYTIIILIFEIYLVYQINDSFFLYYVKSI